MTLLKCSATTCVYNKEYLCSRGEIDVMWVNAHDSDETCCGSFQEREYSSTQNAYRSGCGCDQIQVDCAAHNCTYNDNCRCTAASISVDGANAKNNRETKCSTFQAR